MGQTNRCEEISLEAFQSAIKVVEGCAVRYQMLGLIFALTMMLQRDTTVNVRQTRRQKALRSYLEENFHPDDW